MELYILRHGIAAERGNPAFPRDPDRPLTPEGEKKIKRIAAALRSWDIPFDLILSSPFLRARQTAELAARLFKTPEVLKFSEHLAIDGDPEALIDDLAAHYHSPSRVLLVGHEPYLTELISVLVTGGPHASILLKKGGVCKLAARKLTFGKCATLEWLLTPRQLLQMG